MIKQICEVGISLLSLVILAVTSTSVRAAGTYNGDSKIISVGSELCIGFEGSSVIQKNCGVQRESNPTIVEFISTRSPNRQFLLKFRANGRCVDIFQEGTTDRTPIIAHKCHGRWNQRWTIRSNLTGSYEISNPRTGKCLDVFGGSQREGAKIILFECRRQSNQKWNLDDVALEGIPEGSLTGYSKVLSRFSRQCLDSSEWRSREVVCSNTASQRFGFFLTSDGDYEVKTGSRKHCLDILQGSAKEGTPIIFHKCHGKWNQRWYPEEIAPNYYRLVNPKTSKCLQLGSNPGRSGDPLQLRTCGRDRKQAWRIRSNALQDTSPPSKVRQFYPLRDSITESSVETLWRPTAGDSDTDRYRIYLDGKQVADIPSSTRRYTIEGLDSGQFYSVSIVAVDAAGNESTPNSQGFRTLGERRNEAGESTETASTSEDDYSCGEKVKCDCEGRYVVKVGVARDTPIFFKCRYWTDGIEVFFRNLSINEALPAERIFGRLTDEYKQATFSNPSPTFVLYVIENIEGAFEFFGCNGEASNGNGKFDCKEDGDDVEGMGLAWPDTSRSSDHYTVVLGPGTLIPDGGYSIPGIIQFYLNDGPRFKKWDSEQFIAHEVFHQFQWKEANFRVDRYLNNRGYFESMAEYAGRRYIKRSYKDGTAENYDDSTREPWDPAYRGHTFFGWLNWYYNSTRQDIASADLVGTNLKKLLSKFRTYRCYNPNTDCDLNTIDNEFGKITYNHFHSWSVSDLTSDSIRNKVRSAISADRVIQTTSSSKKFTVSETRHYEASIFQIHHRKSKVRLSGNEKWFVRPVSDAYVTFLPCGKYDYRSWSIDFDEIDGKEVFDSTAGCAADGLGANDLKTSYLVVSPFENYVTLSYKIVEVD